MAVGQQGTHAPIHRADTDELLYATATDANGQFSVSVHHDTLEYYAQGRAGSGAHGRSDNVLPGQAADVDFAVGGGISRSRIFAGA